MKKKLFSYFLLSLFLGFYASVTLFSHSHIINGVTIVHSHIYSSGTGEKPVSHQHTAKGVSLIQLLSDFSTTIVSTLFGLVFFSLLYKLFINPEESAYVPAGIFSCSLRAPPIL